jgi:predicted alpha/beta superfamily hydrolase
MVRQCWRLMLLLALPAIAFSGAIWAGAPHQPFRVGYDIYDLDIRMNSFVIKPKNTRYNLQIDISRLPGTENLSNLPVIYVTDGQWRRMDHKYVHYLTYQKIIPPVIVAGIGYTEENDAGQVRTVDFLIRPENFLKEIKEEIIPRVEKAYPVDPSRRILFGSSLGGRFTVFAFLTNLLQSDATFAGFLGGSPYLAGSNVFSLAKELTARQRTINAGLYLAYGANESESEYHSPNNTLFKLLENNNLQDFRFFHHVYPNADHFDTTRLTLIDGLRLLLGDERFKGVGAVDLDYRSYCYDFKTSAQYYDWKTNRFAEDSFSADPRYSLDPDSGSFKVTADFSQYRALNFETSSVYFPGFADRQVEASVYIPGDLAGMGYTLKFLIYSTFAMPWIADTGESLALNKSGWNTFKYQWRGQKVAGNLDRIRGFGVIIERPEKAPAWKGELFFDNIQWK